MAVTPAPFRASSPERQRRPGEPRADRSEDDRGAGDHAPPTGPRWPSSKFDIDTGSRASFGLLGPFVEKNGPKQKDAKTEGMTGWGVGGPACIVFDYGQQRMIFEPNANYARPAHCSAKAEVPP